MADSNQIVTQHLQDSLVKLAITSTEFLRLTRGVVPPEFFSHAVSANCVRICYDFFDAHKQAPIDHFHDEIARRLPEVPERDRPFYVEYLKKLQTVDSPNLDYVLRRLNDFVRCREFESAAIQFAELVRDGKFDEAQVRMYKALKSGVERENIGCDYFNDFSGIIDRTKGSRVAVSTGIPGLDQKIGGFCRTQLICVLGGYKGKKSWAMQNIAKTGLLWGMKVLYVSHELTRDQIERRMDRMFGSFVDTPEASEIDIVTRDERTGAFERKKEIRPSVYDVATVKKVRRRVAKFGGRLIIKKYPMGTCSITELERYLDYLERFESFVPDILINDYADIMSFKGRGTDVSRHGLNEIYIGHKTLADERNMVVVTASQGNRDAIRKKRPKQTDVAEDIRKLGNVDMMLGVCQTDEMVQENIGSAWVIVNRDGPMDCGASFLMNLDIGQFCVTSWVD